MHVIVLFFFAICRFIFAADAQFTSLAVRSGNSVARSFRRVIVGHGAELPLAEDAELTVTEWLGGSGTLRVLAGATLSTGGADVDPALTILSENENP